MTATVSGWELGRVLDAALGGGGGPFKVARLGIDLARGALLCGASAIEL